MNEDLKQRIKEYKELNWSKFLRKDLGEYSLEEAGPSLDRTKRFFDVIVGYTDLDSLPQDFQNRLRNQIWNQVQFLSQIVTNFQNTTERAIWLQRIQNREQEVWNDLGPVYSYLQALGTISPPTINPEKLREAERLANLVIESSNKYKKAAETAENWIKTEGTAIATAIQDKSKIFDDKANNEHTGYKVWLWLIAAGILGAMTIGVAWMFVYELHGQDGISIGAALLRIAVIGALSYTAFIAYQQFNIQRRLYETYKFKAIALSTMEELLKTYSDSHDRESILNQAIAIIFSEPTIKEEKAVQERLIDELLDVLKKKA